MIAYRGGYFGFGLLFRFHGSAAARALMPSLLSEVFFFVYYYGSGVDLSQNVQWRVTAHPYPMTAFVVAFTFLLTFRANFAYSRYWEAAGDVLRMQSKWLDVGMMMSSSHLQSNQYDMIKPPSFGKHPELKSVVRERERLRRMSIMQLEEKIEEDDSNSGRNFFDCFSSTSQIRGHAEVPTFAISDDPLSIPTKVLGMKRKIPIPERTSAARRLHSIAHPENDDSPSLFLQELGHLLSLLSAVALSGLRSDVESAESPLTEYIPGEPWPPEDPDELAPHVRKALGRSYRGITIVQYLSGYTRNPKQRTLYNASRPFRVLGGISDAESEVLQSARGPYAKTALCTMWLQEFISREYLNGSTGNVAPPILSRLYQYTSDGMLWYSQARKVAFIPFPFPHAQITSIFMTVLAMILPMLNLSFSNYLWTGAILNFCTMMCFAGLHEVARELEDPFQNAPNDIPLNRLQAQFNEALITMYAGYHPDAYWTVSSAEGSSEMGTRTDASTGEKKAYGTIV